MSILTFKPGDVLRYHSEQHHCRQGMAFVRENGVALDTYWHPFGDGDSHRLTEEELASAQLQFNVNDFDQVSAHYERNGRGDWEKYRPSDRDLIGSQHQYQETLFVRKGAKPHLGTQVENARREVEEAESELRVAQGRLEACRRDLEILESQASA